MPMPTPDRPPEWFLVTPDGRHVVTRYQAPDEAGAWELVGKHFCQYPAERPVRVAAMKADGFTMSPTKPREPEDERWREFNDLVALRNTLWALVPPPGYPGHGDPRWKALTDGFTDLIDHNARLRHWLSWALTAEPAELEQWRNGEFAAGLANNPFGK